METIKKDLQESLESLMLFVHGEHDNTKKIMVAGDEILRAIREGNKIITCGNGGSMCDAMHFAEELTGRYREDRPPIAAVSISDPSHLTCVGNDYGFDQVFSRFVHAIGQPGDILLVISTSGNSENILNAAKMAIGMGLTVIGLTGKDGGKLSSMCDVELRAPKSKYADRAQEIHGVVIHALIGYIERQLEVVSPVRAAAIRIKKAER
jgi:D-sedoheptulose 7-phosphate isomerase